MYNAQNDLSFVLPSVFFLRARIFNQKFTPFMLYGSEPNYVGPFIFLTGMNRNNEQMTRLTLSTVPMDRFR